MREACTAEVVGEEGSSAAGQWAKCTGWLAEKTGDRVPGPLQTFSGTTLPQEVGVGGPASLFWMENQQSGSLGCRPRGRRGAAELGWGIPFPRLSSDKVSSIHWVPVPEEEAYLREKSLKSKRNAKKHSTIYNHRIYSGNVALISDQLFFAAELILST